jgi:N,N-dimethylformamidase
LENALNPILGYTNKLTVRPGDTIDFKVSTALTGKYAAQLVKLINGDCQSNKANFKEETIASGVDGLYEGKKQPIYSGSCIVVKTYSALDKLDSFTLSLRFQATMPGGKPQCLIAQRDGHSGPGWALMINDKGQLTFLSSTNENQTHITLNRPVRANQWSHASIRFDGKNNILQLNCRQIADNKIEALGLEPDQSTRIAFSDSLPSSTCPLVMAADFQGWTRHDKIIPGNCFNGRLEAPFIYKGILDDDQLTKAEEGKRPTSLSDRLVADWDFSDHEGGTQIFDQSENKLHGATHNLPLRALKGAYWDGSEFNWTKKPEQYGAIHFHDDDLYDCGWDTDFSLKIPDSLRSGVYAMRLNQDKYEEYLPFFVAAPRNQPQAKLAFIIPTFTYLAYANNRIPDKVRQLFGVNKNTPVEFIGTPGEGHFDSIISDNDAVGKSTYDLHNDGSPVHHSSWLRPILNMRPKTILWTFCADLLFIDWMDAKDIAYDIITDDLLQEEGTELLNNYHVVMSGNHPEYPTLRQLDAIEEYITTGGRFMYMGGNGYYWRTAVHKSLPGAIEIRRGRIGTRAWQSGLGEVHMAFTGEPGGIWRESGRAPQKIFGVGFAAQGNGSAPYHIKKEAKNGRAAFILKGVDNETIGDYGVLGAAAGEEIDQANPAHGTPSHAIVLASSKNHGEGMLLVAEEVNATIPLEYTKAMVYADMVFFETPGGGAMFAVGSMSWCGSLGHRNYQNDISTITENVITRFIEPTPFPN